MEGYSLRRVHEEYDAAYWTLRRKHVCIQENRIAKLTIERHLIRVTRRTMEMCLTSIAAYMRHIDMP